MSQLTTRRRQILDYVTDYTHEHGYGPSLREIGAHVGLASASSVSYQVAQLRLAGHLAAARTDGRRPRITVTAGAIYQRVADDLAQFIDDARTADAAAEVLAGMEAAERFIRDRHHIDSTGDTK